MVDSIKSVLMKRDGISEDEAEAIVEDLREQFNELVEEGDLEGAYHIASEVGLEPDYMEEFI